MGPFRYCMKLGAKWPKLVQLMQKFGPRSRVEFFAMSAPDWTHGTLNSCFGAFHSVQVHLGLFYYGSKTRCKTAELVHLVQKFVPRSRIGIFRNELTRSIPLDPKQMFWCVSYYFGAFWAVWLPYKTRCKTGPTSVKVRATKLCQSFSQRTCPIHPIGP